MGSNPSRFVDDNYPVEMVSWNEIQKFVKKLNEKEGTDKYRLPSEAEWEYACRAGTSTRYSCDDDSRLNESSWYDNNSGHKTHPIGQKKPNPWGLYDTRGNVWEVVQDEWHDNYNGALSDGRSWEGGNVSSRVGRGGGWAHLGGYCCSSTRIQVVPDDQYPDVGFRLLREL
jgi:formylglycine-generating enzyme required for sulfatase activity